MIKSIDNDLFQVIVFTDAFYIYKTISLIIILDIYKGVYIHHFSYSNEENTKDLNNLLWQEIYQSVIHNKHKNTYDKENTVQNK